MTGTGVGAGDSSDLSHPPLPSRSPSYLRRRRWELLVLLARVATREESGVLGFPSRRGLTPWGRLECKIVTSIQIAPNHPCLLILSLGGPFPGDIRLVCVETRRCLVVRQNILHLQGERTRNGFKLLRKPQQST